MKLFSKKSQGFSIIESVIAVSIIGTFVVALAGVNNLYLSAAFGNSEKFRAYFLAEEGLEAVKFLRDESWDNRIATLTPSTSYRLNFEAPVWRTYNDILVEGEFTRSLTVEEVYRDANDNIAPTGTLDPDTRLARVWVSWQGRAGTESISLETYITNLFDN